MDYAMEFTAINLLPLHGRGRVPTALLVNSALILKLLRPTTIVITIVTRMANSRHARPSPPERLVSSRIIIRILFLLLTDCVPCRPPHWGTSEVWEDLLSLGNRRRSIFNASCNCHAGIQLTSLYVMKCVWNCIGHLFLVCTICVWSWAFYRRRSTSSITQCRRFFLLISFPWSLISRKRTKTQISSSFWIILQNWRWFNSPPRIFKEGIRQAT